MIGKGQKIRTLFLQRRTRRALHFYLNGHHRAPGQAVFLAESGSNVHEPLSKNGLYGIISKLFKKAGIKASKSGPHMLRHIFAIEYLRGGGRSKELMMMLGHEDLKMTNDYTAITEADCENQHRKCSPVERMKL